MMWDLGKMSRRTVVVVLIGALLGPIVPASVALAAEEVRILLVAPLSGRWARQGQLKKLGAEMAIEEINAQGGIKALGGAKVVLREADAGDSVEKAVSAAQRVLTREKISAGIGAWLSSFTLGVTEVAERQRVPWFSLSYADSITERGFQYTFQTSPVAGAQAVQALDLILNLAKANNVQIRKAALVGDNTAASVFFFKPLREKLLQEKGIELVVDEIWTPPLPDATPVVQKLRSIQPDIVFFSATALPDSIQVLQKVKEFGLMPKKDSNVQHVMIGEPGAVKSWLQVAKGPSTLAQNPAVLAGVAGVMAQMAMRQTMDEITDYLDTINEKVDDVLRAGRIDERRIDDLLQLHRIQHRQLQTSGRDVLPRTSRVDVVSPRASLLVTEAAQRTYEARKRTPAWAPKKWFVVEKRSKLETPPRLDEVPLTSTRSFSPR